ncbi:MAG TPA: immunoglobulin domain-containing protein, partial [Chthoniobacteraceae bacterium]|nr:immunoglobulin domain-containing protein [Chthoniobacteraceae bacterium]
MLVFSWALLTIPGLGAAIERHAAAGSGHVGVIRPDNTLWVGGNNSYGQLGDGSTNRQTTAIQVASDVISVFAGSASTLWIKSDRSLWATGENYYGQFGDGSTGNRYIPGQIATNVASVAAGSSHLAYVKTNGTLWTSGQNYNGQLGDSSTSSRTTAAQVATSVIAAAVGSEFTLYLKSDGTLMGMGNNYSGQLTGTEYSYPVPRIITTSVTAIAAYGETSFFLKNDGTFWGMGNNSSGQLGDGTTSTRKTPVQIATNVIAVAAGSGHTVFLKTDGTLWATGNNGSGELGDGTTSNKYVPVQAATNITFIAAGGDHTLFRRSNGTVWGLGSNGDGEFNTGSTSYSAPYVYKLFGLPEFVTVPIAKTLNPSDYITLSASATGGAPLTLQWRKNGTPITGATSTTYSKYAEEADEGAYDVVATNPNGTTTTAAVMIVVNDRVAITQPPQAVAVMPGQPATFEVTATGMGPLTYQWRKNSSNIVDATGSSFTLPSVVASDAGSYTCRVANSLGSEISASAALTVGPAITVHPVSKTVNPSGSTSFSVTATGTSLTYQWRRNEVPIPSATSSSVSVTASKANEGSFDVIVSNAAGSATSNPATLSVNEAITIVSAPESIAAMPGQPLTFQVSATGTGPITYQWRKNGTAISGETEATLTFTSISAANSGNYTCSVTNPAGTVTTAAAEITVSPAILAHPANQTVNPKATVLLSVAAVGTGPLQYQWRKNGVAMATGATLAIQSAEESDEGDYTVMVTNVAGSVISERATLRVNDLPKIVAHPQPKRVRQGDSTFFSVEATGTSTLTYQWRKDGISLPGSNQNILLLSSVSGSDAGQYDVVVSSVVGEVTGHQAALTLDQSPLITRQPESVAVRLGANISLSVEATGGDPLAYQWFHNGVPMDGATEASLVVENLSTTSLGDYRVRVSNESGAIMSSTAEVSIGEWKSVAGSYQSLFARSGSGTPIDAPWPGRLTATVNASGALSGRL